MKSAVAWAWYVNSLFLSRIPFKNRFNEKLNIWNRRTSGTIGRARVTTLTHIEKFKCLFRFKIYLKNQSRHKLNHPIWTKSAYLLSIPPVQYRLGHTRSSIENFSIPSSNSESFQKLGLDTIWNNPIEEDHQTFSWCPDTILGIAGATSRIRPQH